MTDAIQGKLSELLSALGDTPEQVALILESEGVKGVRRQVDLCPVAQYLTDKAGIPVAMGIWTVWTLDHVEVKVPRCVTEFVFMFDKDKFPHLDAANHSGVDKAA